jgi:hypothetical protein
MVKKFITFDGEEPTGVVTCDDDVASSDFTVTAIEVDYGELDENLLQCTYQVDGKLLSREPRPSQHHIWENREWVFSSEMYLAEKAKQTKRDRAKEIAKGFTWANKTFQIDSDDLKLIAGRTAKLNILLQSGNVTLDSTGYTDLSGTTREIVWRALDNTTVNFTVREFLTFAQAVDEYIEDIYQKSWIIN